MLRLSAIGGVAYITGIAGCVWNHEVTLRAYCNLPTGIRGKRGFL